MAFLVHEPNAWLYSRSAFLHHAIGWMLVVVSIFPLGQALRPGRVVWRAGFAFTFVLLAVLLFADRDVAPIFGRFGAGAREAPRRRARGRGSSHCSCPRRASAHVTLVSSEPVTQSRVDAAADRGPAPLQRTGDDHVERGTGARS